MVYSQTWRGGLFVLWLLMTFVWTTVLAQETIPVTREGAWLPGVGFDYSIEKTATATFTIPRNPKWDYVVITGSGYARIGVPPYPGREYQIYFNGIASETGSQGTTTIYTSQFDARTIVTMGVLPGSDSNGLILYKVEGFAGTTNVPDATSTSALTSTSSTSSSTSRSSSTSSTSSTSTTTSTTSSVAAVVVTTSSGSPITVNDPLVSFPSQAATPTGGSSIAAASDTNSSDSKRTSTIVGVVLGLLALAVLCVFLVMWYRRKLRKDRIPPSMAYMNYRSTTTEPPVYGFAPSRAGGGGIRDLKGAPADRDTLYSTNAAGLGAHGAHGTGNWDDEKYGYGAIPATRGYHDGAMASLPWPAPPSTTGPNGMMPGQFNKPLPAVAPSALMQQPNSNPFSASSDPIMATTAAPMRSEDSGIGGPIARTLTPEPDRSSRASSAFGDMNPYGGIALGVMPTATPVPTMPATTPAAPVAPPPPSAPPMAQSIPAQNMPQGIPFQPQQAMGNPFLGPSEENFAGRGAGHWNQTNNA